MGNVKTITLPSQVAANVTMPTSKTSYAHAGLARNVDVG